MNELEWLLGPIDGDQRLDGGSKKERKLLERWKAESGGKRCVLLGETWILVC